MVAFDKELWRDRARSRAEKARKRSRSRRIDEKYGHDLIAISAISKVIDWCNERGLVVDFTKESDGALDLETQTIQINGRCLPENQLFYLLHECGHYLVNNCGPKKISHANAGLDIDNRSLVSRVALVSEEFEAWDRGRRLAERLNLIVSDNRFNRVKAHALSTYFRWATRKE